MNNQDFLSSNAANPLNLGFTFNELNDPAILPKIGFEQTGSFKEPSSQEISLINFQSNLYGNGLTARYFNNPDLTDLGLIRTEATIDFNWGKGSPDPAIAQDTFSASWQGLVQPLYSEQYTFSTQSDDGARLWVNGELLIDQWQDHGTAEYNGVINLEAGKLYNIQLDYYENGGEAVSKLLWSSDNQVKQIIPTSQLYSTLPTPVAEGNGNGLTARYFNNPDLTDLGLIRTEATIDFNWGKGSPDPAIAQDTFSASWQGLVQPLYSEQYTFSTQSDDGVKLWVNGELLIDQWQDHPTAEYNGVISLEAGKLYDIQLDYYENGGEAVSKLLWSSDSQVKQIIPTSQLYSTLPTPFKTGFGQGLKGEYFDNKDLTASKLVRTDATIDFNWGNGSPDPAIAQDTFSASWKGLVQPLFSEQYTFSTQSDDGVKLWVNGELLIDQWQDQSAKELSGVINLEAGKLYDIQLDYYENGGEAVSKLLWSSDSQVKEIIPTSQLYKDDNQPLIGIIDTGFSGNNPDINYLRVTLGKDRVDNDNNPLLTEGEGNEHGTHILGIIGATQDNDLGIDGINDDAPIWLGRAIGEGKWAESLREFVDALKASGRKNGIANFSFDLTQKNSDGTVTTRYELTPQERAALEYARQNGVLIVAAAGNNGGVMSVLGQASQEFDNIITVGAADGENRADYSSYGNGLDILADGGTIDNPILSTVGDGVGTMAGTSVAAAMVTGAASQIWYANPLLSYRQLIDIVKSTATNLSVPGWDAETGAGLLNIEAAIEKAKITTPEVYNPTSFLTPTTWAGDGLVTPLERAADGSLSDGAGNTRETARNIGTLTSSVQVFSDRIDSNDKDDFYSFYIAEPGAANISITNLSQNARVEFFKGSNAYSDFSSSTGSPQYSSTAYIDGPGQYFLRIAQDFNVSDTDYTLQLSTTSSVTDIGSLIGGRSIMGSTKYYRFKLDNNTVFKASSNFPDELSLYIRDANYKDMVVASGNPGTTLNAGTYYLAVSPNYNASKPAPSSYTLNFQATPTSRYDNAGSYFRSAYDLGTISNAKSSTDFIDPTDKQDYYSFTVDSKSSVNLSVAPISGNAAVGVTLYDSQYDYLNSSYGFDGAPKPLVKTLEPGKYFVFINDATGNTDVQYRLDINAQSLSANDAIGNTFAQVKDLGSLYPNSPLAEFKDAIGGGDPADWFRFKLEKLGNVLPVLDGLTAPVSLQLMGIESNSALTNMETLNSNGESKWTPAFNNVTVGDYALVLKSNSSASTPYTLNLSTVSTNVAPTDLEIKFNSSYAANQDVILTGKIYDANGASDIQKVLFQTGGKDYTITGFTPSVSDNSWAEFSYNLGKLPVGSYRWSGTALDQSNQSSGTTITLANVFEVTNSVIQSPVNSGFQVSPEILPYYSSVPATQKSKLGSPISNAANTNGTWRQEFENGSIIAWQGSPAMVYFNDSTSYELPKSLIQPITTVGNIYSTGIVSSSLSNSDARDSSRPAYFVDDYLLTGATVDQTIKVSLTSNGFIPQIFLVDSLNGSVFSQSFSVINGNKTELEFQVFAGQNYAVRVTSQDQNATGDYTLSTALVTSGGNENTGGDSRYPTFNLGKLTGSQTVSNAVGGSGAINIDYQFDLDATSNFNLKLDGLSQNANVSLGRLTQNSDSTNTFTLLDASYNPGTAAEIINQRLESGTYAVRISSPDNGVSTNFNLALSAVTPTSSIINGYEVSGNFYSVFWDNRPTLGNPIENVQTYSSTISYQRFEDGSIVSSPSGTFIIYGDIRQKYLSAGGLGGSLGVPTSEAVDQGNGTLKQTFQNGYIFWNGISANIYRTPINPIVSNSGSTHNSGSKPNSQPQQSQSLTTSSGTSGGENSGSGNSGSGNSGSKRQTINFGLNNQSIWGEGQGSSWGGGFSNKIVGENDFGVAKISAETGYSFDASISGGTVNVDLPALFDLNWQLNSEEKSVAVNFSNKLISNVKIETALGLSFGAKLKASAILSTANWLGSKSYGFESSAGLDSGSLLSAYGFPASLDLDLKAKTDRFEQGTRLKAEDIAFEAIDIVNTLALIPQTATVGKSMQEAGVGLKLGANIKQESFFDIKGFEIDYDGVKNGNELIIGANSSGNRNIPLPQTFNPGQEFKFTLNVKPIVDFWTQFSVSGNAEASFDLYKLGTNLTKNLPDLIKKPIEEALPKISFKETQETPYTSPWSGKVFNPYTNISANLSEISIKIG